jgi:hypothetical protein
MTEDVIATDADAGFSLRLAATATLEGGYRPTEGEPVGDIKPG